MNRSRKVFKHGDLVRVAAHGGRKAFVGKVYSWYQDYPGAVRRICVEVPSGGGVGFCIRYVNHVKRQKATS